jgi:hypothetical protein
MRDRNPNNMVGLYFPKKAPLLLMISFLKDNVTTFPFDKVVGQGE